MRKTRNHAFRHSYKQKQLEDALRWPVKERPPETWLHNRELLDGIIDTQKTLANTKLGTESILTREQFAHDEDDAIIYDGIKVLLAPEIELRMVFPKGKPLTEEQRENIRSDLREFVIDSSESELQLENRLFDIDRFTDQHLVMGKIHQQIAEEFKQHGLKPANQFGLNKEHGWGELPSPPDKLRHHNSLVELHFMPAEPIESIAAYNLAREITERVANQYGATINWRGTHIHFSMHGNNGKNRYEHLIDPIKVTHENTVGGELLQKDVKQLPQAAENMLMGILATAEAAPLMFVEKGRLERQTKIMRNAYWTHFSAGSSKNNFIRFIHSKANEHFELRSKAPNHHYAMQVYALLNGIKYGLENDNIQAQFPILENPLSRAFDNKHHHSNSFGHYYQKDDQTKEILSTLVYALSYLTVGRAYDYQPYEAKEQIDSLATKLSINPVDLTKYLSEYEEPLVYNTNKTPHAPSTQGREQLEELRNYLQLVTFGTYGSSKWHHESPAAWPDTSFPEHLHRMRHNISPNNLNAPAAKDIMDGELIDKITSALASENSIEQDSLKSDAAHEHKHRLRVQREARQTDNPYPPR